VGHLEGAGDDGPKKAWSGPGKAWIEPKKVQMQRKRKHNEQKREPRKDKRVGNKRGRRRPVGILSDRSMRLSGLRKHRASTTLDLLHLCVLK
jgi:hypothetical protein